MTFKIFATGAVIVLLVAGCGSGSTASGDSGPQIQDLTSQVQDLESRLSDVEGTVEQNKSDLDDLSGVTGDHETRISDLESR
jgi:outer membrane murein-binding lipoprotein Lpp